MQIAIQRLLSFLMSILMAFSALFGINTDKSKKVQNVILMIGDGMGFNTLAMTEYDRNVHLTINTFEQCGESMTYSASDSVTDSAAGATALSCGIKTYNKSIGYYWFDMPNCPYYPGSVPKNLTELCMENGMKTGIVTSDYLSGATPGGFSAHTTHRNNKEDILDQQLKSNIDLLWGRGDEYLTEDKAAAAGYVYIDTIQEMNELTGNEKSIGQFTSSIYHTYNKNDYTPTLSQAAAKAIELLDKTSDNGFFLMIEGAHIDKKSHNMDRDGATEAVLEFDKAIKIALDFAKKDGNTLLVITADHETGGIFINSDGNFEYTSGSHSGANVPIRAYGPIKFIENETIENTEIAKRIARALEFDAEAFPCEVKQYRKNAA